MTPEISLPEEHCTYLGSFCKESSATGERWMDSNSSLGDLSAMRSKNGYNESWCSAWPSEGYGKEESDVPGKSYAPLKGICPSIGYWQRLGIHLERVYLADNPSRRKIQHKPKTLHSQILEFLQSSGELRTIQLQMETKTEQISSQQEPRPNQKAVSSDKDQIEESISNDESARAHA